MSVPQLYQSSGKCMTKQNNEFSLFWEGTLCYASVSKSLFQFSPSLRFIVHTSSLIFFWNVLVHSWWSHSQNFRLLLECKWTLGSLQCLRGQHYASVADGRWNTKLLIHFLIINPLTPKISLVILLIVCQMILIMLILRIWYWIN